MKTLQWAVAAAAIGAASIVASGCSTESPSPDPTRNPSPTDPECITTATLTPKASTGSLTHRAYVASRDSGNVTVIDLDSLEIVASVETCSAGYHMVELSADFSKAYASSSDKSKVDVLDARTLGVAKRIDVGHEPTHMSLSRDGKLLAVMDEGDGAISFVDPERDVEIKRLPGFYTPHFLRYGPEGRYGYVANAGAYHITRVDLSTLSIDGHIALDGFDGPPRATETTAQIGFADTQIDGDGVLWAAHGESGQVLRYDTKVRQKLPELRAGIRPWIVYAEHPFPSIKARVVPNHGDRNVALLHHLTASLADIVMTGEPESYGVNFSPLVPEKAFVMNRIRQEIAVVDTKTKLRTATIPVGGNTETASTTADGRWVVAAVSSANRVVVIDTQTNVIVKTFDNVGKYPWTVTIPLGQNYCH